jgi:hypothetical protein
MSHLKFIKVEKRFMKEMASNLKNAHGKSAGEGGD